MGQEAVVVKNGLRLCGTGSARGSAPILQDKVGGGWISEQDWGLSICLAGRSSVWLFWMDGG